jgi:hypothetical protein
LEVTSVDFEVTREMCTRKIENGYLLKHGGKKTIKYAFKKCLSKLNYLVNR